METWNRWRKEEPEVKPDLSEGLFKLVDLGGANFRQADMLRLTVIGGYFGKADLIRVDLREAHLVNVDLTEANLHAVDLSGSWLGGVRLCDANLSGSIFCGTDLSGKGVALDRSWLFPTLGRRDT